MRALTRGAGCIRRALLLSIGAWVALLLVGFGSAVAADREVYVKVQYTASTCPSGKPALHPLPLAQLIVSFGSRTIRRRLDDNGIGLLTLKGRVNKLRATVVLDGALLAVNPYGKAAPYSFSDTIALNKHKVYTLTITNQPETGAASAWAILSRGTALAARSMPGGVKLPKLVTRYTPGRSLPDGTGYRNNQIFISTRPRADEFEPWVLLHEYGHHVQTYVASPGPAAEGPHDLERSYPNNPALPWSEGFGDAYAAIALQNPVLGTLCRTKVNISASPAIPHSKDPFWLNQYHEISIAGVLWGLTGYFGGGKQQAGLKPLLAALHVFSQKYGGPHNLREARDALIEGGLEQGSAARHMQINSRFWAQGISWGLQVLLARDIMGVPTTTAGYWANWELHLVLRGPSGWTCESTSDHAGKVVLTGMMPWELPVWSGQVGAQGGLPYVSTDDCLIEGGDGNKPYADPESHLWLSFPYLAGQAHRSGVFTLTATLLCQDAAPTGDARFLCTSSQRFKLVAVIGPGRTLTKDVTLSTGSTAEVLRFDAIGHKCTVAITGDDCSH